MKKTHVIGKSEYNKGKKGIFCTYAGTNEEIYPYDFFRPSKGNTHCKQKCPYCEETITVFLHNGDIIDVNE